MLLIRRYDSEGRCPENIHGSQATVSLPLLLLFALGLLFLLGRAKYGFCFNDEPFCVTLGQRLYNGDALIAEEWHGCQLFSAIMLPFYSVFRLFSETNEGILLFLRYCYCILWWFCSIYTAVTVSPKPLCISLVFLFLLLFSPLDYMTISYTSVGLMSALAISCILYRLPVDVACSGKQRAIGFSLLWAVLVLCSPFMVVVYIGLLVLAMVGAALEKKVGSCCYFYNLLTIYRYAFLIDCVLGVLFIVVFILSRADLSSVIESIPHILADPEHQSAGIVDAIYSLAYDTFNQNRIFSIVSVLTFLFGLCFRPQRGRVLLFGVNVILYLHCQINSVTASGNFNVQMLQILFLGLVAFSLLQRKKWKLFLSFYGFCGCFTLMNGLASNTGIIAVSMTATVAGCAAIVFILQLGDELWDWYATRKSLRVLVAVFLFASLGLQISSELYLKFTRQYWDSPPYQLTDTITCGAAKGLKTTSGSAYHYQRKYESLQYMLSQVDTTGKRFLSSTSAPYLYLDADLDFATFSAWSFGYEGWLNDRILNYQAINPEMIPDIIYCASEEDILPLINESYVRYEHDGQYLFVKR